MLWGKLQRAGLEGWALQAVQALYAAVPMCVKTQGGYTRCFETRMGVKQGGPLRPTLFSLYLDDFAEGQWAVGVGSGGGCPSHPANMGVGRTCATPVLC